MADGDVYEWDGPTGVHFRQIEYRGTYYHEDTPTEVRMILAKHMHSGERLILIYGDVKTGRAWGRADEWNYSGANEVGSIGRSMGPIRIPLAIYNRRSIGGPAILDHCVVKIIAARGKRVLWQHPAFHDNDQKGA